MSPKPPLPNKYSNVLSQIRKPGGIIFKFSNGDRTSICNKILLKAIQNKIKDILTLICAVLDHLSKRSNVNFDDILRIETEFSWD